MINDLRYMYLILSSKVLVYYPLCTPRTKINICFGLFLQSVHENGFKYHPDERRRVVLQILSQVCYRLFSSG